MFFFSFAIGEAPSIRAVNLINSTRGQVQNSMFSLCSSSAVLTPDLIKHCVKYCLVLWRRLLRGCVDLLVDVQKQLLKNSRLEKYFLVTG